MTRENAHLYIPHVEALRDGELQREIGGTWHNIDETSFDNPPEKYRRRPKARERWIVELAHYDPHHHERVFTTEERAKAYCEECGPAWTYYRAKEVL